MRDKKFYKSFIAMAAALALQQLLSYCVNLADNIMLGAYSETALSGSALVSQVHYILQLLINGIGTGIVILGSRYWGMRQSEPIRRLIGIGWKFAVALGAAFSAVTMFAPDMVLSIFTNDVDVLKQGHDYLRLMSWTFVIFSASYSLVWSMRSIETTFIGPVLSAFSLVTNICLNYIFIFGKLGSPEMGIEGAALATLISRVAELVLVFIYVFLGDKKLRLSPKDVLRFDSNHLRLYLKVTLPVVGALLTFSLGISAQTVILGHTTSAAIAANSIMSIVWQIFAVVGLTCGGASAIIIGKAIGEGKESLIKSYSITLQCLYVLIGVFSAGILFASRSLILSLYDLSPETMELSEKMLVALCVVVLCSSYQYPVASGIIQGGGNTGYTFIVDTAAMWFFALPLAYISAFVIGWSPFVTFCILRSDQCLKVFINGYWVNKRRWFRQLIKQEKTAAAT